MFIETIHDCRADNETFCRLRPQVTELIGDPCLDYLVVRDRLGYTHSSPPVVEVGKGSFDQGCVSAVT